MGGAKHSERRGRVTAGQLQRQFDDPDCPNNSTGDTYYVYPAQGCTTYRIVVNDPMYKPGPSTCPSTSVYGPDTWPAPLGQNQLVRLEDTKKTPIPSMGQVAQGELNN